MEKLELFRPQNWQDAASLEPGLLAFLEPGFAAAVPPTPPPLGLMLVETDSLFGEGDPFRALAWAGSTPSISQKPDSRDSIWACRRPWS